MALDYAKYMGTPLPQNVVTIRRDDSCNMYEVLVNDKFIMMGNWHDFHNACHGHFDIGTFKGPYNLANLFVRYIQRTGNTCTLVRQSYKYF